MNASTKTLTVLKYNFGQFEIVHELNLKVNCTVLDLLNAHKIGISQSCGGSGSCTTCRINVIKGSEYLAPRTEIENERALERNYSPQERLACQTELNCTAGNIEIVIVNPMD